LSPSFEDTVVASQVKEKFEILKTSYQIFMSWEASSTGFALRLMEAKTLILAIRSIVGRR